MEAKNSIELTPKQIGVILAVILAIAGGLPTGINKLVPEARYDSFTGAEGDELNNRLTVIELNQQQIMEDDKDCEERQQELERRYHDHVLNGHPESVRREIEGLRNEMKYYFRSPQ